MCTYGKLQNIYIYRSNNNMRYTYLLYYIYYIVYDGRRSVDEGVCICLYRTKLKIGHVRSRTLDAAGRKERCFSGRQQSPSVTPL